MKRFIYIQAMSIAQSDLVAKIRARRVKVAEHLEKCAMYGDMLGEGKYNHWIEHELATWISEINELTTKPSGKKLKPEAYSELLFGLLGDERADSHSALIDLQLYNSKKKEQYPYIEIDNKMVNRMYRVTQEMLGKVVPILSSKNRFTKKDIENLLHNLLDPICKGVQR